MTKQMKNRIKHKLSTNPGGTKMATAIGIGGCLAAPFLPHHRAYGSVPRRFGWLNFGFGLQEQR